MNVLSLNQRYSAETIWARLIKRTIARFARGNIAAQNNRVMLQSEQQKRHEEAKRIAESWRPRASS